MATRAETLQTSSWALELEVLSTVLRPYMTLELLLKARTVCKAWAAVWGSHVQGLSLEQPMSVPAARNMGRKAAAAFPAVSTVRIPLVRTGPEACLDLTSSDDAVELPMKSAERPHAAKALVQQLQKLVHLRKVHFSTCGARHSTNVVDALPQAIMQLPAQSLQMLDLTEVQHSSDILPTIAACLTQLTQLTMQRMKPYCDTHMEALAALAHLRTLKYKMVPFVHGSNGPSGVGKVTQLQSLTLKLVSNVGTAAYEATIRQLSSLTALQRLQLHHPGLPWLHHKEAKMQAYSAGLWPTVLQGMRQLQYLEVNQQYMTDAFLQAAGQMPKLENLVIGSIGGRMGAVSASGAQAVSQVTGIEVWLPISKNWRSCCKALTSLLNCNRFVTLEPWSNEPRTGLCWHDSKVCTCDECWDRDEHCKKLYWEKACCGHCQGRACRCPS